MVISIGTDGSVTLADVDRFNALEMKLCEPVSHRMVLASLCDIAQFDEQGSHAWVDEDWLKEAAGRAGDAAWEEGFAGMLSYAQSKGWRRIKPQLAVRVHVTRVLPE